jgi:putative methionine-R-sulfoxide reductase with GAF domain
MTDTLSRQVTFLIVCSGGILLILIGAYALVHPEIQAALIWVSVGAAALLAGGWYVLLLVGKRHWFPRVGTLLGLAALTWVGLLSGGFHSDFWPAFSLVTVGTVTLLSRQESIPLYVLTAICMIVVHAYQPPSLGIYPLSLILVRIGSAVIPAELYRRLYQLRKEKQTELLRISLRERKVERDLTRRNIELHLLNNVALTLNSTLDLDSVLTQVIGLTNTSMGIEIGSVSLLDEETGELVIRTLVGKEAVSVDGLRIPKGEGIGGWVCEHDETALVHDVQHDPRFYRGVDEISGFATRSMICVPLRSRERVIGAIEAMNKTQGRFTREDQQLLEGLAAIAAPAIENAQLHTRLRQVNHALQQRYDELERTQDQLVAAEKRAAAVELAGAAAHQLNQPLTVILCSLGMVRRTLPPDHEALGDLDVIEQAVEDASATVKRIGSITEYKTKTYIEGIQILDFDDTEETSDPPPSDE